MRKTVLAGIFALSASTSLAQTSTAPTPLAPAAQTASPTAPAAAAPTDPAALTQAASGGPANLCQELLAFMKVPPPEPAAPAAAPKPTAAPAQPSAQQAAPAQQGASNQQTAPAEQPAPAGQGSSALAGTTAAGAGATSKPETGSNSAQAVTGQDGVATDAPKPSNDKAAAGSVANAPQKDSLSAPLPPADVSSTPKESVVTVEQAEELATANDIGQCQTAARKMRVAGVAMPPPLIALAALDLQYHQEAGQESPPAGAEPAAAGQAPASQTPAPQ